MFDEEKPEVLEEKEEQEEPEEEVETEEVQVDEEVTPEEEPEVDEEPEEEEVHYENAVNKGDFIKVEMTGSTVETGEVFETTSEETAQESGMWEENRTIWLMGCGFGKRSEYGCRIE